MISRLREIKLLSWMPSNCVELAVNIDLTRVLPTAAFNGGATT